MFAGPSYHASNLLPLLSLQNHVPMGVIRFIVLFAEPSSHAVTGIHSYHLVDEDMFICEELEGHISCKPFGRATEMPDPATAAAAAPADPSAFTAQSLPVVPPPTGPLSLGLAALPGAPQALSALPAEIPTPEDFQAIAASLQAGAGQQPGQQMNFNAGLGANVGAFVSGGAAYNMPQAVALPNQPASQILSRPPGFLDRISNFLRPRIQNLIQQHRAPLPASILPPLPVPQPAVPLPFPTPAMPNPAGIGTAIGTAVDNFMMRAVDNKPRLPPLPGLPKIGGNQNNQQQGLPLPSPEELQRQLQRLQQPLDMGADVTATAQGLLQSQPPLPSLPRLPSLLPRLPSLVPGNGQTQQPQLQFPNFPLPGLRDRQNDAAGAQGLMQQLQQLDDGVAAANSYMMQQQQQQQVGSLNFADAGVDYLGQAQLPSYLPPLPQMPAVDGSGAAEALLQWQQLQQMQQFDGGNLAADLQLQQLQQFG
jgi:hypothetical protein